MTLGRWLNSCPVIWWWYVRLSRGLIHVSCSIIRGALNVHFDSLQYKPAFIRALRTKQTCWVVLLVVLLSLRINNQIVQVARLSRTRPDIYSRRPRVWLMYDWNAAGTLVSRLGTQRHPAARLPPVYEFDDTHFSSLVRWISLLLRAGEVCHR